MLLLSSVSLQAQSILLRGIVYYDNNTPAANSIVMLLQSDSTSIAHYTTVDAAGKWIIPKVAPGQYFLHISAFGYETSSQRIEVRTRDTLTFNTLLLAEAKSLQMVLISAKRIGIVERGDTLQYNIGAFTDSTEYNLKDILNKLPQMSVSGDGTIRYKGERVKVTLTEGRDLFGGIHKTMVEGIRAEDVQGVQIIRNYTTAAEQTAQTASNDVALNVQLTEQARRRLNGDIKALTDAHQFAEAQLTAYRTRPKMGYSTTLKANNTAQPLVGIMDFLNVVMALDELPKGSGGGDMQSLLPQTFFAGPDVQRNGDALLTFNLDANPKPRWRSNVNLYYLYADRRSDKSLIRFYLNDDAAFAGQRNERMRNHLGRVFIKNEYQTARHWLKSQVVAINTVTPTVVAQSGLLDSLTFDNNLLRKINTVQGRVSTEMGRRLDSLRAVSVHLKMLFEQNSGSHDLQGGDNLFGSGSGILLQDTRLRRSTLNGFLRGQMPLFSQKTFADAGYSLSQYAFHAQTSPLLTEQWNSNARMRDNSLWMAWEVNNGQHRKMRYKFNVKGSYVQRIFQEHVPNWRYWVASIEGGLFYDFVRLNSLYLTGGYEAKPIDFIHVLQQYQIRDENSVAIERLDPGLLTEQTYLNINRIMFSNNTGLQYRATVGANWRRNDVIYQAFVRDNYLEYRAVPAPSTRTLSAGLNGGWQFNRKRSQLSLSSQWEARRGYAPQGAQLVTLHISTTRLGGGLHQQLVRRLNLNVDYTWESFAQRFGDAGTTRFRNQTTTLGLNFKYAKWVADASFTYQRQGSGQLLNRVWPLSFQVEYRLIKPRLRLHLEGRNVLNLKGNTLFLPDFSPAYTGLQTFRTIGGQVLAGVSYLF